MIKLSSIHLEIMNVYHSKGKFSGNWNWKGRYHEGISSIKNDVLDEFNEFKSKFLHKIKSFKDSILNTTVKNAGNQEHAITLLLDNITFLKDQLRQKYKVIDSLINQFSQQNSYLFQKWNTDDQLETNLERVKSKETEKIITSANSNKTEDTGGRKSERNSETNISNNKNSEQDISHEVKLNNASNSQDNIENNDIEKLHSKFYRETY